MGSPRFFFWTVTVAALPLVVPVAVLAQAASGMRSSEVGRNDPISGKLIEPPPKKPPRRGRSRTAPAGPLSGQRLEPSLPRGQGVFRHGRL